MPSPRRSPLRVIAMAIVPGIIAALLLFAINGHLPTRAFLLVSLEGIAYSVVISSLCWLILPRVAESVFCHSPTVKWTLLIVTIAAIAAVGCLLASGILYAMGVTAPGEFWSDFSISIKIGLLLTLLFGISTVIYETLVHRLRAATSESDQLRQMATEARLSSLESRVHPHFLFNTLNSISALIREDPAKAERTVERLASLLRFSLNANESRLVPLSLEIKVVRDYLDIERTRFGDRLRYRIDVPDSMNDIEVPPMSVQTLVENSVKHAVSVRREGAMIEVCAHVDAAGVPSIDVIDDGPGYDATAVQSGHGLDLLQSRLAAMFGPKAALQISSEPGRMRTTVVLT